MKERIKKIMEDKSMTPARFADSLDIGRAVISHILNGRNNPSLDIVTRILNKMPEINSEWLLTGTGTMYKSEKVLQLEEAQIQNNTFPDLFTQLPMEMEENEYENTGEREYRKENIVNNLQNEPQKIVSERVIYKENPAKRIKQIIIYYTDNTFESFNHD